MPADDLDAEVLRIGLWALFAAASLAAGRPSKPDALGIPTAADAADDLLAEACRRWPDLAEPLG